jgi:hypothetical protein
MTQMLHVDSHHYEMYYNYNYNVVKTKYDQTS